MLGPEYAASGVHVPRHIQEEVTKAFCMQKRRAHVETLVAFKAARAEQQRVTREAELMARTKQMLAGKGTARGGAEHAAAEVGSRPKILPQFNPYPCCLCRTIGAAFLPLLLLRSLFPYR